MTAARDHSAWLALIEARAGEPFAWGTNDCVTFAADAVRALTGRDPLRGVRGRWRTEAGAARALARLGGLEAATDGRLTAIPPARAQRGDIAAVQGERGLILMVVEGAALVGPGERGLERAPRAAMVKAWSAA